MNVPYYSKREDAQAYRDALQQAADRSGRSVDEMGWMASHLLEALADQVSRGNVVRIPSFGIFAPWLDERRCVLGKNPYPKCIPKFVPSRAFRQQVAISAPHSRVGKRAIVGYRRNHSTSGRPTREAQRVFTGMEHVRRSISAQLGGHDFSS